MSLTLLSQQGNQHFLKFSFRPALKLCFWASSQRNLAKEESIKFQTHYIAQKSNFNLISQTPSSDVSTE
jgi:hypothetical protein